MFDTDSIKRQQELNGFVEQEDGTIVSDKILTGKELGTLLPQVFTRDGKIRKDTRNPMRGLGALIPALKLAERCRTEDAANKNGHIIIFCQCGHVHLNDELSDHIRATDMFAALASKGWVLLAGK